MDGRDRRRGSDVTTLELVGGPEAVAVTLHPYDPRWVEVFLEHRSQRGHFGYQSSGKCFIAVHGCSLLARHSCRPQSAELELGQSDALNVVESMPKCGSWADGT